MPSLCLLPVLVCVLIEFCILSELVVCVCVCVFCVCVCVCGGGACACMQAPKNVSTEISSFINIFIMDYYNYFMLSAGSWALERCLT